MQLVICTPSVPNTTTSNQLCVVSLSRSGEHQSSATCPGCRQAANQLGARQQQHRSQVGAGHRTYAGKLCSGSPTQRQGTILPQAPLLGGMQWCCFTCALMVLRALRCCNMHCLCWAHCAAYALTPPALVRIVQDAMAGAALHPDPACALHT